MSDLQNNYVVQKSDNSVELWSAIRLPFDPKGWLLQMRNSLRSAIHELKSEEGKILHSVYCSEHVDLCDTENILLYNVGTATFKHLCGGGLCIERRVSSLPPSDLNLASHYQHYHMTDENILPKYWKKKLLLAHWSDVGISSSNGEIKPHLVWYAMKKSTISITSANNNPAKFGVEVIIKIPLGTRINSATVIKPLLDGIVSAFHCHNGADIDELTLRLADKVGEDQRVIAKMLTDPRSSVLGMRNLIHRFKTGIQWNPADDYCVSAKILIEHNIGNDCHWSISGQLFSAEEVDF